MNAASNQQTTALPTLPTTIVNRIIGMAKEIEEHEQEKRMEGYLDQFAEWCREQVNSSLVHISKSTAASCELTTSQQLLHRAVAESTTLTEEEQQQAMELVVDKYEVLVSLLETEQQTWVQQELAEEPDFEDDEGDVVEYLAVAMETYDKADELLHPDF